MADGEFRIADFAIRESISEIRGAEIDGNEI